MIHSRICLHCSKEFTSTDGRKKYCSRSCFMRYRNSLRDKTPDEVLLQKRIKTKLYMRKYMRLRYQEDQEFQARVETHGKGWRKKSAVRNRIPILEFKSPRLLVV